MDSIGEGFSGGAHCCYSVSVQLSSCGRTFKVPFGLDGGYVGGLDLSRPEHFSVGNFDQDAESELFMEVDTYNGVSVQSPRRDRVNRNKVVVDFSGCRMRIHALRETASSSVAQALKKSPSLSLREWSFSGDASSETLKHLARYMTEPYSVGLERDYLEPSRKILAAWGEAKSYFLQVAGRPSASTAALPVAKPISLNLILIRGASSVDRVEALQLYYETKDGLASSRLDKIPPELYSALHVLARTCFDASPSDLALLRASIRAAVSGAYLTGHGMMKKRLVASASDGKTQGKREAFAQSLEAVVDSGAGRFLSVILWRPGTPGLRGWKSYCSLEPPATKLP